MSNRLEKKDFESMEVNILAPGASKETTKIRLIKGEEKDIPSVLVEVNPVFGPDLEDADLVVNETFPVEKRYDVSKIKARVKNGIITVSIPVDKAKVQTIDID